MVILGRYPQWLYEFNSGVVRFLVRLSAWLYLQTDVWPPFSLSDDPNYPIRVNIAPAATRQSRLKALFRPILALPLMLVHSYGTSYIHAQRRLRGLADDRLPRLYAGGDQQHADLLNSFHARVPGYVVVLTDDYPPVGLERSNAAATPVAATPPPPPPAPAA